MPTYRSLKLTAETVPVKAMQATELIETLYMAAATDKQLELGKNPHSWGSVLLGSVLYGFGLRITFKSFNY